MKIYSKLVRDKIPGIIKAGGGEPVTRVLDDEEYLKELIKKLDEETREFEAVPSLEELADIQEVVLALLNTLQASREELEAVRVDKTSKRGAFEKKIYLEKVTG